MRYSPKVIQYIPFGIFPAGVSFCVGFTYDEITGYYKKWKAEGYLGAISNDRQLVENSTAIAMMRHYDNKTYYYIILKNRFDFKPYSYVKLAHEVLHICQFFLPDVLDRNREIEAEAYLHTHIMSECLKKLGAKI